MNIVTVRASALGDFLDCAARAESKHLLGMRTPMGPGAALGKAVHASTAVYDRSTITGQGITVDEAAAACVDSIQKPDEEIAWEDDTPQQAENIAIALHKRYCAEIAPKQDYAAVEIQCERLEIVDIGLALTGTTDRIRRTENGFAISDLKTGKTAVSADGTVKTAGHAMQLGVYELLAERASELPITGPAQIIGLQVAKTEKGQRAGTGEVSGAREVLIGEADSPGVLEIVAKMIHSGVFPGNPRSMLCNPKFCPIYNRCKFRR